MSNVSSIKDTINIRVSNNTAFTQSVNLLGGTSDPLGVPPHILYQWDLSTETYFGNVTATIIISTTANPTPVTFTVQVDGYNIQAVVFALNSLNMGVFQVSGNIIYISNDFYIYGTLTVLSNAFISTWNTTDTSVGSSSSNQIQLPLDSLGNYNFTVYWGDGNQDIITSWNQPETLHTYATSGIYTIGIIGIINGFRFNNTGDRDKIKSILSWGNINLGNNGSYFYGCSNLDLSSLVGKLDLTGTSNLDYAFSFCTSLTTIGYVDSWDTSNVTSMVDTFGGSSSFNDNINSWNTSSVFSMNSMFISATSFNQPLDSWDVSNVSNFTAMFSNATSFNQPLNSWNVSSATMMDFMFGNATNFNQSIISWNVSNVTNMSGMFSLASNFNQNISGWDVSSVTDLNNMFRNASNFNQNIGSWNVSNVQNMSAMFRFASNFNQNISGWDVSSVTDFNNMFRNATSFNQPIGSWDVSNGQNMAQMFQSATNFNQNIGAWNISNITDFTSFMTNKTNLNYSASNLDAIYNGWSLLTVQPNLLAVSFGTIKYTLAGQAGRNILTGAPNNWGITDGGI